VLSYSHTPYNVYYLELVKAQQAKLHAEEEKLRKAQELKQKGW
jgi:hypothetical protein